MPGGTGYMVQSVGAQEQAKALDRAAEGVGGIRAAVADPVCYAVDVFGGGDSGAAYTGFAAAWQSETSTLQGALSELAGKVRTSTAGYQSADQGVVADLSAAAAGEHRPFG
ncbi:hypothetical protein [Kitasatospora sp. NPDC050543]|uniref:hypothetical protein n=1 Tax=Kitasatospora sp. NPDC050543 TaxID=3364054 RepID=UPI00379C35FA